ncbi:CYTH domain-containing protein [Vreelandella rituensis]|uniref:CYTH domain-containing protein n=1 Tax=Vreelandella rituensis TaxID=2282306 RepID=A0A368TNY6_9GAMM|nr:CYTH domain-containing protein [Halomonas rituensis]RCV86314.1 CYTH domain-containing protein [Halomonas rituensis]
MATNSKNTREVELKLALAEDGSEALATHALLDSLPCRRQQLTNTYFDTPEGILENARMALRLRQVDGRTLQTLKTSGKGGGGMSERGEWEWEVPAGQLDLDGLSALPVMQGWKSSALERLAPRLQTNFTRTTWQLDASGSSMEVALDQGEIRAGSHRANIHEAELELVKGDPQALWTVALSLAEAIRLRPADMSKAARGNALLQQHWALPEAETPAQWLHRATVALDAYHDSTDGYFLRASHEALRELAHHQALDRKERQLAERLISQLGDNGEFSAAFGQAALKLSRHMACKTMLS